MGKRCSEIYLPDTLEIISMHDHDVPVVQMKCQQWARVPLCLFALWLFQPEVHLCRTAQRQRSDCGTQTGLTVLVELYSGISN
jgi:hypothetical protein